MGSRWSVNAAAERRRLDTLGRMRQPASLLAALTLLALTACVQSPVTPETSETPSATASVPTPTPTPTPPSTPVAVDVANYATKFVYEDGTLVTGVDFTSEDGNLLCGILVDFSSFVELPEGSEAFGGCAPLVYDYAFERPAGAPTEIECSGAYLTDVLEPVVMCESGATFMAVLGGNDLYGNASGPLGTLAGGSSIEMAGIRCAALDTATIRCTVIATGHGFEMSRKAYLEF